MCPFIEYTRKISTLDNTFAKRMISNTKKRKRLKTCLCVMHHTYRSDQGGKQQKS